LRDAGLPAGAIQLVPTTDRAAVGMMLAGLDNQINVIVPRGGRSLVERVQKEARVPVIGHLEGLCHVYVDRDADADMARAIVVNAKMRRTGICGSAETLLVDRQCPARCCPCCWRRWPSGGCELRGDAATQAADARVKPATEQDWRTEYLDAIISVRVVDGVDEAIRHIATYGSAHTDSIVTRNAATAGKFLREVDSAIVLHNASTQFADGGEFGMGAEIGISTDRFHARGPVGVEQLTSYKYVVRGSGQVRPPERDAGRLADCAAPRLGIPARAGQSAVPPRPCVLRHEPRPGRPRAPQAAYPAQGDRRAGVQKLRAASVSIIGAGRAGRAVRPVPRGGRHRAY
jgi:glutamate-5-semialdehyde dehydrogenase